MFWVLAILAVVIVLVIALVVIGGETNRLLGTPRPAVFIMDEAVAFIARELPEEVASRISLDDVWWVLGSDADLLEAATGTEPGGPGTRARASEPRSRRRFRARVRSDEVDEEANDEKDDEPVDATPDPPFEVLDPDGAVALILGLADAADRDLSDEDIYAVLEGRMRYLEAIGAIGPEA